MKNRISPLLFLSACLFLLIGSGCATTSRVEAWKSDRVEKLEKGSLVMDTPAGPVEYALYGEGAPVLFLHGSMGGYDGGNCMAPLLEGLGIQLISPSRPGYLRTPLTVGKTAEEQARAMALLLDGLGIGRVVVIGGSGGGPASLWFALNYPERTEALVLVSAIFQTERTVDTFSSSERRMMANSMKDRSSFRMARMLERNPVSTLSLMFPDTRKRIAGDEDALELAAAFMAASLPMSLREEGTYNDMSLNNSFPSELQREIRVPTFIAQGAADEWAPPGPAEAAAEEIFGAQFSLFEGDHIFFIPQREKFRGYLAGILSKTLFAVPAEQAVVN